MVPSSHPQHVPTNKKTTHQIEKDFCRQHVQTYSLSFHFLAPKHAMLGALVEANRPCLNS